MRVIVLVIGISAAGMVAHAQSSIISFLLHRIASYQNMSDSFYRAGMFPSYRYYAAFPHAPKQDNNIFFTALTCYTLRQLKPKLADSLQPIVDTILQRAQPAFAGYQKPQHPLTFNFWPVNPPVVFPNAMLLKPFRYVNALPDDADDASMIWLALHPPDSVVESLSRLHGRICQYIHSSYSKYVSCISTSALLQYLVW